MEDIILCTGDMNKDYEIIDVILTSEAIEEGVFKDPTAMDRSLEGLKEKLREKCVELGGNAVIKCKFKHEAVCRPQMLYYGIVVSILAYGTVVKFR